MCFFWVQIVCILLIISALFRCKEVLELKRLAPKKKSKLSHLFYWKPLVWLCIRL